MNDPIEFAKRIIKSEASAIGAMAERLDDKFYEAVKLILSCKGRVIISGMGKSGLIGKKIAATFNSTGIASYFLHPAEAMHGDLGLIKQDDVLMLISKSGQQGEVEAIVGVARRLGVSIILLGGTVDSPLYRRAEIALDCSVDEEACPHNMVPTSSSTAALVMGDALALVLLEMRNFSVTDFANLHPGGAIGFRLLKHIYDFHHFGKEIPLVSKDATLPEMIVEMTSKRLGCVLMVSSDGKPMGVFTDGDLRRLVEQKADLPSLSAEQVMHDNPRTVNQEAVLDAALATMEQYSISQLATVDKDGKLVGVIHLHDILKSKLV